MCQLVITFLLNTQVVYHGTGIVPFTDHIPLDSPGRLSWTGIVSFTNRFPLDSSGSLSPDWNCHLLIIFLLIPQVFYHGTGILSFTDHFPFNPQVVYHRSGIMSFTDNISLDSSGGLPWDWNCVIS